jgi:hypothetical protein
MFEDGVSRDICVRKQTIVSQLNSEGTKLVCMILSW